MSARPGRGPEIEVVSKTTIKIGDTQYEVDLSKIPYLASFVNFQTRLPPPQNELVHSPIPLFEVALKGIESGYRQCFRLLPIDLAQYYTLCETYDFLCIDVLRGQSHYDIVAEMIHGKPRCDDRRVRKAKAKANRAKARDAVFKLVYLILMSDFENEVSARMKIFNAVERVVMQSEVFERKARIMVRAAFQERFNVSYRQRAILDQREKEADLIDDLKEVMTD